MGFYAYFKNVSLSSSDAHISFDMSWGADGNGQPKLSVNSGDIELTPTSAKVHGSSGSVT